MTRRTPNHWLCPSIAQSRHRTERQSQNATAMIGNKWPGSPQLTTRDLLQNPRPLPRTRKSLSELTTSRQNPSDQSPPSSRLLQLPTEIRLCIWTYVLCGQAFHIRLLPCEERAKNHHLNPSFRNNSGTRKKNFDNRHSSILYKPVATQRGGPRHLLSLLKTCRQIYAETVDLAYGVNTFAISDLTVFFNFVRSIPLERLAVIRYLDLIYKDAESRAPNYYLPRGTWRLVCHTLETGMPGLRHLSLHVLGEYMNKYWVAPLLRVKQLTSFDLSSRYVGPDFAFPGGCVIIVPRFDHTECFIRAKELQSSIRRELGIKEEEVSPSTCERFVEVWPDS